MDGRLGNLTTTNATTSAQLSSLTCFHFTNEYFERVDNSPTPYVVTSVLNALLSVTAFWGNVLILLAIWKTASLHSPSKLLIFNLALTDFAIGLICQPLFAAFTAEKAKGSVNDKSFCVVRLIFHLVSSCLTCVSFFGIAAISLDRYIAVRYYYSYREIVQIKRVSALVLSIWLLGGLWASTWVWKNELYYPIAITSLLIFLPLTSLAYMGIYRGLNREERTVQDELGAATNQRRRVTNMRNYRRSATGMLYVYCLMILCYLPYLCTNMFIRFTGKTAYKQTVLDLASTVVFMNSSLNPIVYCWRLRSIRSAVLATLRAWNVCTKRQQQQQREQTMQEENRRDQTAAATR